MTTPLYTIQYSFKSPQNVIFVSVDTYLGSGVPDASHFNVISSSVSKYLRTQSGCPGGQSSSRNGLPTMFGGKRTEK